MAQSVENTNSCDSFYKSNRNQAFIQLLMSKEPQSAKNWIEVNKFSLF